MRAQLKGGGRLRREALLVEAREVFVLAAQIDGGRDAREAELRGDDRGERAAGIVVSADDAVYARATVARKNPT
ncbi:MAG TPA: hypothetical protein VI565_06345, partial [Burkholderiales bacterium]|nr:hypothetical protein [Burkholderiales bacterium]